MAWGAVAGAVVGGLISSQSQSNASQQASNTQQQSTSAAIAEQQRQFDITNENYRPYREAGYRGLGAFESQIGQMPTPEEVMADPGYQFGLKQGQLGLDRKAAAAGGRVSGAALKAASTYATDYAASGYDKAYQRRQDRLNRLAALAQIGQTSTAGTAQYGSGAANQISGLLSSQGDATAAGQLARGSIWGNAGNQLAAAVGRYGGSSTGSPLVQEQIPGQYSLDNVQYG